MKIRSLGGLRRWNNKADYLKDDTAPIVLEWFIEWWVDLLRDQQLNQCREAYWELVKFAVKANRIMPFVALTKTDQALCDWISRFGKPGDKENYHGFHDWMQGKS